MIRSSERLSSQRLELVPMVEADAPALFAILGDPQAMTFWHRPAIQRLAVVEEIVGEQLAAMAAGICRYWTVFRQGDPIGSVDLSLITPQTGRAEMGFLFRRDQWGHGYAREALGAAIAHAFGALALKQLVANTRTGNLAAQRVLEHLGFERERIVQGLQLSEGLRLDCAVYVLWRDRQASAPQKGA